MTTTPSGLRYTHGVEKQTNETTPLTTAQYTFPTWAGNIAPITSEAAFAVTNTSNLRPGWYRQKASWQTNGLVIGANAASAGLLFTHMLGLDTISGAGDPYTHTITAADPDTYWTQFWERLPDDTASGVWIRYEGGMVSALELQYSQGEPVKLGVEAAGKTLTYAIAAPTVTNAEVYATATASVLDDYLGPYGHTFNLDYATSPASTGRTFIESCNIKVKRDLEYIWTTAVTPTYRKQGLIDVEFGATVVWESYDSFRNSEFGSASGTALTSTLNVGSADFTFNSMSTSHTVEVKLPNMIVQAEKPQVDPNGGAVKMTFTGLFQSGASALTVIAKSAKAVAF